MYGVEENRERERCNSGIAEAVFAYIDEVGKKRREVSSNGRIAVVCVTGELGSAVVDGSWSVL